MKHNQQARSEALSVLQSYQSIPTSLVSYQSQGRLVIVADADSMPVTEGFSDRLSISRVWIGDGVESMSPGADELRVKNARDISASGYLGQFQVMLTDVHGRSHQLKADMLLDATSRPLIASEVPPAGYLHRPISRENLAELEAQLLDMVGEFEKPKFFRYDPSICAHSSNGQTVCTRCIDACPTDAISSLAQQITVDPHLCQGGGTCATVCPSGAMQYVYPRLSDQGNRIREMLQAYHQHGGEHPLLVFHSEQDFPDELLQQFDNLLPVGVDELASVGMELCLSAIAYGASQVLLLANAEVPATSRHRLEQQLQWLRDLLQGFGLDARSVDLLDSGQPLTPITQPAVFSAAEYSMPDNKRAAFYQALDQIYRQCETTAEVISLPAGAPFGNVIIDEQRCTLCMACVGACPGKALQDGSNRELPEVFFIESHCLQCGSCSSTCPEQAITLVPRLILDREQRNRSRMLHQDTPFLCIGCGKPFATSSVIDKMSHALQGHHMFQNERARNRLKMCEDCRVADIVQDPEAMNGQFDPLNTNSDKRLS